MNNLWCIKLFEPKEENKRGTYENVKMAEPVISRK